MKLNFRLYTIEKYFIVAALFFTLVCWYASAASQLKNQPVAVPVYAVETVIEEKPEPKVVRVEYVEIISVVEEPLPEPIEPNVIVPVIKEPEPKYVERVQLPKLPETKPVVKVTQHRIASAKVIAVHSPDDDLDDVRSIASGMLNVYCSSNPSSSRCTQDPSQSDGSIYVASRL